MTNNWPIVLNISLVFLLVIFYFLWFGALDFDFLMTFFRWKIRDYLSNVLEIGKTTQNGRGTPLEITYFMNGNKYRVSSPSMSGIRTGQIKSACPRHLFDDDLKFIDAPYNYAEREKFAETFGEYLGPFRNFHGIPTTPKMLGIEYSIVVEYRDERIIIYDPDDIVQV